MLKTTPLGTPILEDRLSYEYCNVPMAQFKYNQLLIYNQYLGVRKYNRDKDNHFTKENQNAYTGEFTTSAKKNLRRTIDIFSQITKENWTTHIINKKRFKFQLAFITLTIPNSQVYHPSFTNKFLMSKFVEWLVKTKKTKYFIWKLEWQKRGQIHYHITIDNQIHFKEIQSKWNYFLSKLNMLDEYREKYKKESPPSTKINKVYKVNNINAYLQKEFSKSLQNEDPNKDKYSDEDKKKKYRLWDGSLTLKAAKHFSTELENIELINPTQSQFITGKDIHYFNNENCQIFTFKEKSINQLIPASLKQSYYNHLTNIKQYERKTKTKSKQNNSQSTEQTNTGLNRELFTISEPLQG